MERLLPRWLNPFASNRARRENLGGACARNWPPCPKPAAHRDRAIEERDTRISDRERHLGARLAYQGVRGGGSGARRPGCRSQRKGRERVIPLGRDSLLVRLDFGGRIVLPTWKMNVAVSIVRDGIIEPWTQSAGDILISRDPDAFVEGWSDRFVDLA